MQAPKENYSSITKLNQSNTFGKKDLLMSFMKVTMKTKMFKCQKTIIQTIKKVIEKYHTFFLVKICVMNNVSFRSIQQKVFYENKCSAKTCSGMYFFCTYGQKTSKIRVKEFIFCMVAGLQQATSLKE